MINNEDYNKNIQTPDSNTKSFWKILGVCAVALFLAVFTVVIINL